MKEFKDLRKRLIEAGCRIVKSKRNSHHKVYYQGILINSMPSTTGDHRSLRNTLSQLRRAGVPL